MDVEKSRQYALADDVCEMLDDGRVDDAIALVEENEELASQFLDELLALASFNDESGEFVQWLLQAKGADPEAEGALHQAAEAGNAAATKALIAAGANVDARDQAGRTPLQTVVWIKEGDPDQVASTLIEAGAQIDILSAIRWSIPDIVERELGEFAPTATREQLCDSALMSELALGSAIADYVVEHGAPHDDAVEAIASSGLPCLSIARLLAQRLPTVAKLNAGLYRSLGID